MIKKQKSIVTERSTLYAKRYLLGFSLVETIVAVAIIMLAITGPMTGAVRGFVSAEYSRDQMKAYYLAEEGLEYIRYVRDFNSIANNSTPTDWLNGLVSCVVTGSGNSVKGCGVDPNAPIGQNILACTNPDTTPNACNKLNFNIINGLYSYQTGNGFTTPTSFRRWVKIYGDLTNSNERKVVVSVEWKTGSLPKKVVTVTGFITDWKQQPSI